MVRLHRSIDGRRIRLGSHARCSETRVPKHRRISAARVTTRLTPLVEVRRPIYSDFIHDGGAKRERGWVTPKLLPRPASHHTKPVDIPPVR